jgi:hypothetical protein
MWVDEGGRAFDSFTGCEVWVAVGAEFPSVRLKCCTRSERETLDGGCNEDS